MAYTLRVTFTGIIGLIHDESQPAKGAMLVLPRALQGTYDPPPPGKVKPATPKKALDQELLNRHLAILRLPGTKQPISDERLVYLDGEEIAFLFVDDEGSPTSFSIHNRQYLVPFKAVTPFNTLDPAIFHQSQWNTLLMSRLHLTRGSLTVERGEAEWTLPDHLQASPGSGVNGCFSFRATWEVQGLENPVILRLQNSTSHRVEALLGDPGGVVDLRVVNLDAAYALEWEIEDRKIRYPVADPDFRWFYELLDDTSRSQTKARLGTPNPQNPKTRLPVPLATKACSRNPEMLMGGGMNCLMADLGGW